MEAGLAQDGTSASGVWRAMALAGGPALGLVVYVALGAWDWAGTGGAGGAGGGGHAEVTDPELARRAAGIAVWMAVWWLTEAIPLSATSLIPMAALPAFGVMPGAEAVTPYAARVIFLYLGGFMLAKAMERWGLHRRLALGTLLVVGPRPVMMVAGFMAATAGVSMWLSNTATAVMMLPIAVSVVGLVEEQAGDREGAGRFAVCVFLGIAYSASIGGVATPIGTAPTAMLIGVMRESYGVEIGFVRWMLIGVPLVLVFLPLTWLVLTRLMFPVRLGPIAGGRATIRAEIEKLGPLSAGERWVLGVLACVLCGWVFRGAVAGWLGSVTASGGASGLLGSILDAMSVGLSRLDDAGVAVLGSIAMFAIPCRRDGERTALLDWATASDIPWGILLLFGGGLSLGKAVSSTGLDAAIGSAVGGLSFLPGPLIVVAVVGIVVVLTEFTSNTATAAIFIVIMSGVAGGLGMEPVMLAAPASLAASCAFMLPVATPPNAIVYAAGRVTVGQMARAGLVMNVVSVALVTGVAYALVGRVL